MRRDARRDANERTIVDDLRAVGALVYRLNDEDIPDLLVGWLRPGQLVFRDMARASGLPIHEVRTSEQALRAIGVEFLERREA
jgi:hypothetical protein